VINNAPIHPSLADVIAVISILLIYYFPPSPPPPQTKCSLLIFGTDDWRTDYEQSSTQWNGIIKLWKKIIIIIKWVRWPAVLSCDWWLDSVAGVTSAVCEGGAGGPVSVPEKNKPRYGRTATPPPSQGLGNITSSTILSCTVICSRQSPRLYCTVLAVHRSVLYSTGLNCKATFVFPFRDSRKMPLSQPEPSRNWHFFVSEATAGIK